MRHPVMAKMALSGLAATLMWAAAHAQSTGGTTGGTVAAPSGIAADPGLPGTVVSDATRRSQAPSVAVGKDGSIHVAWLDKGPLGTADKVGAHEAGGHSHQAWSDVYYAHSTDGGKSYSMPQRVNAADGEVWGFSVSKPSIGIGPTGIVHVAYPANEISEANGKPVAVMHYVRSVDGGKTFSKPLRLNSNPPEDLSAAVHGGLAQAQAFATLSVGPEGNVYAAWLDTRVMTNQSSVSSTYMAVSRDDGKSWEAEHEAFGAESCPCCQLTSAIGSAGELFVASRVVHAGNHRDPMVSVSHDGAKTFSPRVSVGGPAWILDGCPLKPTALAASGATLHAAVFNGAVQPTGVLYSRSTDGGKSFGEAIKLHPEATVSDAPTLGAHGHHALAFWHAKVAGGERRVYGRRLEADGARLGPVFAVGAASGASSLPAAATLPDGTTIVAWQQGEQVLAARVPAANPAPAGGTPVAHLSADGFSSLMARQQGQLVVLNLWATWCVACLKEIPDLVALQHEFAPRGVRLIAVSMDEPGDLTNVEAFRQRVFPATASTLAHRGQ